MLYRLRGNGRVSVDVGGVPRLLDPSVLYTDDNPADAEVIRSHRGLFAEYQPVEHATAAPGERRNTRRANR
ncbi:MAG: hypothetical protein KDB10_23415 [Acidimicrobiales bacterium]|nr:hypothetical protein [Acidimicrobiales bacterium]